MRATHDEIHQLLTESGGALRRRDHPRLATALDRLLRDGRLVAPFPGVYAAPDWSDDLGTTLRALTLWRPDIVVTGTTAARLTFWSDAPEGPLTAAGPGLRRRPGVELSNRRIDPDLVVEAAGGVRVTAPALTAVDLAATVGGDAIDAALRSRWVRPSDLYAALEASAGRRDNPERRRLLLDSRDKPWSGAERHSHRLLRDAGISGWVTNHPVLVCGHSYFLDIAFVEHRLVIEIDGRAFHDTPIAFEADRARQNDLVLAGWRVLRFTWRMLVDEPAAFITAVLAALR